MRPDTHSSYARWVAYADSLEARVRELEAQAEQDEANLNLNTAAANVAEARVRELEGVIERKDSAIRHLQQKLALVPANEETAE